MDTFGRYELLGLLASGGMAEVHVARQRGIEGFERLVALKRILAGREREGDLVELFLEEARLAARLRHPNVVIVHDAGVLDGNYFLAMELVHGADVRKLLATSAAAGRRLRIEEAISIAIGVCAGLHHAHEQRADDGALLGVIHRDVSPSNVLLSYAGEVKVADFGIARAADRQSWTAPGSVRGKVGYLSPEQLRNEVLDRRSDVFAVGLLLYELTTGVRAYDGQAGQVLTRVLAGPPEPPSHCSADYPSELEAIVMRALATDRDLRHATARELQLELEAFARGRMLAVSAVTVERLMSELFSNDAVAYREAAAAGTLVEHVLTTATATMNARPQHPLPPSPPPAVPHAHAGHRRWPWAAAAAAVIVGAAVAMVWLGARDDAPASAAAPAATAIDTPSVRPTPPNLPPAIATPPPAAATPPPAVASKPPVATKPVRPRALPARKPPSRAKAAARPETSQPAARGSATYWDPEAPLPPGQ